MSEKMKIKTILLTSGWATDTIGKSDGWRVEKVTDSLSYSPGQMLAKDEVGYLCNNKFWKVTIVAFKAGR